jgi:2-methylisocitrate lyase-like PEP mutase family enzyme
MLAALARPLNVLVRAAVPPVAELAEMGVARVSVGSSFALVAYAAAAAAARELSERGTYGFCTQAAEGSALLRAAFGAR